MFVGVRRPALMRQTNERNEAMNNPMPTTRAPNAVQFQVLKYVEGVGFCEVGTVEAPAVMTLHLDRDFGPGSYEVKVSVIVTDDGRTVIE
jgi:hypothetical protein